MEAAPLLNALQDQKVGRAGRDLDIGRADDGAAIKVRGNLRVMHLGERRHFLRFEKPPTRPSSFAEYWPRRVASTRANSYLVVSRSPVAIGMLVPRATSAICSGISGGTGSSNHSGS